jgi:HTH-type transcriptional regulator/antitoxin HigA
MIDRLMASGKLTKGQELYLETLVQLVQAYEASHQAIEATRGIDLLKHLMQEHGMNASDLARLLGVHASMGSKILKGDRALTVDHLKLLAAKFHVRADTFMD